MDSPSRSGVFDQSTDARLEAYAESISFDRRLFRHDVAGSIAHARMLADVGLISSDEADAITKTLGEIQVEIESDQMEFRNELEDIHMHIESRLIERLGDVGRKLHTARSRNDQVSTDTRLWIRDAIDRVDALLMRLQSAFIERCDEDMDIILPAYTHLQRAQPVLAPHYWLAYVEKFARDRERLADARRRVNISPLGIAAVAGTTLPIDRTQTADALGFEGVSNNSLDSSSDRDFVLECVSALAITATHLSTWAEEWILWSTVEYGVLQIPQTFCTGSSIMPQKVNPDTLELTRGKAARVMGQLQTLMLLVKNLPLAYNRDLQEDKPPLFDAFDTIEAMLALASPIVRGATLDREAIAARLDKGYLDATTLMEWMIVRSIPQRTAHHLVGQIVGEAIRRDVPLSKLPLDVMQSFDPRIDPDVYGSLGCENAVKAFRSYGSTAPDQVRRQIDHWRNRLKLDVSNEPATVPSHQAAPGE